MLWYEFASADEVKEILENFLYTYGFTSTGYKYSFDDEKKKSVVETVIKYPSTNAYEIAEALWGEYSEEIF